MAQQSDFITPAINTALAIRRANAEVKAITASARSSNANAAATEADTHKKGFFGKMWSQISENLSTTLEGIHSAKAINERKKRGAERQRKARELSDRKQEIDAEQRRPSLGAVTAYPGTHRK